MRLMTIAALCWASLAATAYSQQWVNYAPITRVGADYRAVAACLLEQAQSQREWGTIANVAVLESVSRAYINLSGGGAMDYEVRLQQAGQEVSVELFTHQPHYAELARAAIQLCTSAH